MVEKECGGVKQTMNAFEMELKKILSQSKEAAHTTYVGRAAYIQVAPELRAKLEFVSLNIANQYNALKLTVLNRIDGAVDINILRFGDLLGRQSRELVLWMTHNKNKEYVGELFVAFH